METKTQATGYGVSSVQASKLFYVYSHDLDTCVSTTLR